MEWLLGHLYSMREGRSPFDSEDVMLPRGKAPPKPLAPFVPIVELAAEIDMRIDACGQHGIWLKWYYCEGKSVEEIAQGVGISPSEVEHGVGRAVAYICGRQAKKTPYRYWRKYPGRGAIIPQYQKAR